jgi:predicted ATP-grasp superfamily ATP-dependent carboligase
MVALGGGVTLAGVLNILRRSGTKVFAVCPPKDFVRHSRWYHPFATALPNPGPPDLAALLETSDINSAVLLPCSDDWLRAVATLPAALASRFPSSTSPASVDLLTDKWRFARLLEQFGIPRPRTQLILSREQCQALPDSFFEGAILKPLSSVDFACRHGVKGYLVENRRQAAELIDQLELPIMLQEFIPGPPDSGYFLDGFRDRTGRITALFGRRRLRMFPQNLGNSTLIESVPLRNLSGAVLPLEHLLERISYRGVFSAEFKFDERDCAFKLIEINARPWWYVEFASRCGVDVCTMAYQDALGLPVPATDTYQVGRRCVFAVNDLRGWRGESRNRSGLWSLLGSWLRCDSAPFHWNDPAPALHFLRQTVAAFFEPGLHQNITKETKSQPQSVDREPVRSPRPRGVSLAK